MPKAIADEQAAFQAALRYLTPRMRTEQQLVSYLRRRGADDAALDYALRRVHELRLLDDDAAAQSVVREGLRAGHGRRYIAAKLQRLGLEGADITDEDELEACMRVLQKLTRQSGTTREVLARKLYTRGFYETTIHKALRLISLDASP